MKRVIEEIKYGFNIALSELFLFVGRIVVCLYFVALPLGVAIVIPSLVSYLLILCEVDYALLVFKSLFSLFQILALSISMSMVSSDEQVPESDPGRSFIPSKDLIIAIYVMINIYIWGFI